MLGIGGELLLLLLLSETGIADDDDVSVILANSFVLVIVEEFEVFVSGRIINIRLLLLFVSLLTGNNSDVFEEREVEEEENDDDDDDDDDKVFIAIVAIVVVIGDDWSLITKFETFPSFADSVFNDDTEREEEALLLLLSSTKFSNDDGTRIVVVGESDGDDDCESVLRISLFTGIKDADDSENIIESICDSELIGDRSDDTFWVFDAACCCCSVNIWNITGGSSESDSVDVGTLLDCCCGREASEEDDSETLISVGFDEDSLSVGWGDEGEDDKLSEETEELVTITSSDTEEIEELL